MAFLSLFSPPVNHYVKWFITEALLHSGSGPSHSQLFSPVTLWGRKKENILDKGPVSTSYGKLAAFAKVEIPITSHCEDAPKGSLATRNSAKVSTPLPDPQLRAKMLFSLLSASIYLVQSSPLLEPSKIPKMHLWDTEVLSCLKRGGDGPFASQPLCPSGPVGLLGMHCPSLRILSGQEQQCGDKWDWLKEGWGAHACKKNNDRGGKKVLYVTIDGSVRLASDFTLCGMH